ncbi:hypothetical protein F4678DRAFT_461831 [Xylaria arbuscula]|nr:hypothetical protein F4678DRAFT_461831 [Xylaria arbuscula]
MALEAVQPRVQAAKRIAKSKNIDPAPGGEGLGSQASPCKPETQPAIKRVIQCYGSQSNDNESKLHINQLVNNTDNKTERLNGGDPDGPANDWFWNEINEVQQGGIKDDLGGIDLDIDDDENGCTDDSMTLEDTIHLIKQLRNNFGPDFIIILAPVSNALLDLGLVSCFSYKELEKRAASDINWYNAQFYRNSWNGLATPDYCERYVGEAGWKPERIVTTIATSSSFTYPYPRSS